SSYDDIIDIVDSLSSNTKKKPIESWLKSSLQNVADLFVSSETLPAFKSENHLLYSVWQHLTTLSKNTSITNDGNAGSLAALCDANRKRSLSTVEAPKPMINGKMADFYYKYLSHEMGCIEIGIQDKGMYGTKEMHE
ncbi:hypothetical protein EDC96DRAFT_411874, partial [Choanephora cucurbitarum]